MKARTMVRAAILTLTVSFLLLQAALSTPAQAAAGGAKKVDTGFDLVILRTFGFCSTLVGAGLFLPAALLTLPNGKNGIKQAKARLLDAPVEFTFQRKLGEW